MTLIQKLQHLSPDELAVIEDLFLGITEGAFLQVFRDMEHDKRDLKLARQALEKIQEVEAAPVDVESSETTPARLGRGRDGWMSDTWMLRLAHRALKEAPISWPVSGVEGAHWPFDEPFAAHQLIAIMEKQRVDQPYGH